MSGNAFVTIVSIQPTAASPTSTGMPFQNRPQAQGRMPGGVYQAKRRKQTLRSKPNGAK